MSTDLVPIPVPGAGQIMAAVVDGQPMVSLRHACEAIGIDTDSQRCVMTTAELAKVSGQHLAAPDTSPFFDALTAADGHVADHERATWIATFAPQLIIYAGCPCGSVFEARDSQVSLDAAELQAVAEASGLDASTVGRVIDAVNTARTRDDHDALRDWQDAHAHCEQP